MNKSPANLFVLATLFFLTLMSLQDKAWSALHRFDPDKRQLVCYVTSWSQYRPGLGKFTVDDVDPHLCTVLIYAFGWTKDGLPTAYDQSDVASVQYNSDRRGGDRASDGNYIKLTSLKAKNPDLIVMLAFGGFTFGHQRFSDIAATRYDRQRFIHAVIPYLLRYNFDGIDIDWEYPRARDRANFVSLLQEIHYAFEEQAKDSGRERLLVSIAGAAGRHKLDAGYDVESICNHVDFVNLMSYDFHGQWDQKTGHHANFLTLKPNGYSVLGVAEDWLRRGAVKRKLMIGIATFGRGFTLDPTDVHLQVGLDFPATGGSKPGPFTKEAGFVAYYEICDMAIKAAEGRFGQLSASAYTYDKSMEAPYVHIGDQWIGFDDERSVEIKLEWMLREEYGGAMVWSLDTDDFTGQVCQTGQKYPLINKIKMMFENSKKTKNENSDNKGDESAQARDNSERLGVANADSHDTNDLNKRRRRALYCFIDLDSVGQLSSLIEVDKCTHIVVTPNFCRATPHHEECDVRRVYFTEKHVQAMKSATRAIRHATSVVGDVMITILIAIQLGQRQVESVVINTSDSGAKKTRSKPFRTTHFVHNLIELARDCNFDGLHYDWAYQVPTSTAFQLTCAKDELRSRASNSNIGGSDDTTALGLLNLVSATRNIVNMEWNHRLNRQDIRLGQRKLFISLAVARGLPSISDNVLITIGLSLDAWIARSEDVDLDKAIVVEVPLADGDSFSQIAPISSAPSAGLVMGYTQTRSYVSAIPGCRRLIEAEVDRRKIVCGGGSPFLATPLTWTTFGIVEETAELCIGSQSSRYWVFRLAQSSCPPSDTDRLRTWTNEDFLVRLHNNGSWTTYVTSRSFNFLTQFVEDNQIAGSAIVISEGIDERCDENHVQSPTVFTPTAASRTTVSTTEAAQHVTTEQEEEVDIGAICNQNKGSTTGEVYMLRHPTKCHAYIRCHGSQHFDQTCPSSLVFNEAEQVCDWAQAEDVERYTDC